ncbi:GIY-YIG nuclease family protein [Paenibacillus koleovorans]|uniref:GIY-YIG nuclease family protein n=1 Tax=Paenibacillus koleovorans TaxID=121608 RepID=UPI000FD94A7D|nr:GIY-YIG nuclease family protein [Paenibacillus koleovorans]
MDKQRKKALADQYTQSFRTMGVYQIRNLVNGKRLLECTMDLNGMRNRFDFCKQMNTNTFTELRHDWTAHGPASFVFEELDRIEPREETAGGSDEQKKYKEEVEALLELWLEKLQPYGEQGYNKPRGASRS